MSQERFEIPLNDGQCTQVIFGWDKQKQCFYLTILALERDGSLVESIYNSANDSEPNLITLDFLENMAFQLGYPYPKS